MEQGKRNEEGMFRCLNFLFHVFYFLFLVFIFLFYPHPLFKPDGLFRGNPGDEPGGNQQH